ncbi:TetR/AcrR family transcriptional regulator C-terminal domain-containing protein [Haliea sp. AH-315-K21]|uniref:TetR family transcriptional regulator n=1 Tax=SAR86 cluster bacterium TaxID=2030880 RepID=A0A2A5CBG5_9GAMM|nr:TetR/AcrR family transcriptional regulator C-terminal domain-containing protein [Haliea sp. AH-315-K21]PCJ41224.1 MAG: TetR family transcriptional regulator [SAR86 cluster bacterium]
MTKTRDKIIDNALNLLDEGGLEKLTLKRLADALGIQPPSLYWHFKNKQNLIDAMADSLIKPAACVEYDEYDFETAIIKVADNVREALKSRRDGAKLFAGTYAVTENVVRLADKIIGALRNAGASSDVAAQASLCVIYYVLGFVIEEQSFYVTFQAKGLLESQTELIFTMSKERFPNIHAALPVIMNDDFDERFRFGVSIQVEGIRLLLNKT